MHPVLHAFLSQTAADGQSPGAGALSFLPFVAIAATHVVWPLLWIGFLVAIVLFATGTIGHARSGQRR